jgi:branched-chain amino acid transport system ATP-binding protein
MPTLLEVKGLKAGYGHAHVLHGLDFRVDEGGVTALLGANGAGKTTTLRAICGMVRTEGEIRFQGDSLAGKATEDIVRRGIAHVPDGRGTFMELTVEENFRLGAYIRNDDKVQADFDRLCEWFPRLQQRWKQQAGTLSGGEQQMLAIARALMSRPRLVMFDEPSLGLAPALVEQVFAIVREIRAAGTTVLMVEQNAMAALQLSDRAYLLETGRVVRSGTGGELLASAEVRTAYLGG